MRRQHGTDTPARSRLKAYLEAAEQEYAEATQPFYIDEAGDQMQHKLYLADLREVIQRDCR